MKTDFLQWILKNKDRNQPKYLIPASALYDALSSNNSRFVGYPHLVYSNQLEVKDTTDTKKYVSYLDFHLEIDNGDQGL